jgi:hypothetical protein
MDDPTDRLTRLLIADFRYKEGHDDAIWLDHARRENGRVIFYPNGVVVSVEHEQFAWIDIEDADHFDAFMRFIRPATRRERFFDWLEPVTSWGCFALFMIGLWGVSWAMITAIKTVWRGL